MKLPSLKWKMGQAPFRANNFTPLAWTSRTPVGPIGWQPITRGIRSFVDSGNATEAELATGVADKVRLTNKRAGTTVNILLMCITEALRQGKGGIARFREFSAPEGAA